METLPYAAIILKLFKGVIYSDDANWNQLQSYLEPIREYFSKIGLEVRNYEADGFAYLTQPEDESNSLPRITTRRPISFNMTVFCVLLREQLRQFNANEATEQLVINIDKIRTLLEPYIAKNNDETKFRKKVDSLVKQAQELGFLRQLSGQDDKYQIKAILKAKIDAETLSNLKQKLEAYATITPTIGTD